MVAMLNAEATGSPRAAAPVRRPAPVRLIGTALLIALPACSDETLAPVYPTRQLEAGNSTIIIDTKPSLRLQRDGETLLTFDEHSFQLGVVDTLSDETNYDPYRLYVPHVAYQPPDDLAWLSPSAAQFAAENDGTAVLTLQLDYRAGQSATLTVSVEDDGRFALLLSPSGGRTAFIRLRPRGSSSEGFYGLGEHFDDVNQRGKVRAMQLETDSSLESLYNEAHVPIPLLIGTSGWGWFVESPYPGVFSVAVDDDRLIEAAFGTGVASEQGLPFHLFAEDHPLDVTRHYYDVTGYPKLPARWALGPWIWRDENDDQAQVESDLDTIRDLDLATTGYWIDRPYATAVNTFDFVADQFPDPTAMFDKLHNLGFHTALWHTPYLDEDHSATAALRTEAETQGYYPPVTGLPLNGWGLPVDLTNPDAVDWWQQQLSGYIDLGVAGFKLDYGEDIVPGLSNTRLRWRFADGSDERTMHSQFQRYYHRTYAELLPDSGAFLLCRAATYGDQQNGIIIWPGDLDANFAAHGEQIEEEGKTYTAVGGLPASIIAGLSLGPSGFPFYGADTGGYRHSPPDKETFWRWFEQTALSTVMQVGTSSNDVAWEPTPENGFDQPMLDSYRVYARLHLRLFPYLWSYSTRLLSDGRPIQRALGLAHPELGVHPNDTYLLGDELLVAPVVGRGLTSRTVMFPSGSWFHWFTGEAFEGPGEHEVAAPLGRLPLFIRAGGLVPLLRPTIDSLAPTTEPDRVDSYDDQPGVLYVRAVAGTSGAFELFDGGRLEQQTQNDVSTLGSSSGSELNGGAIFELLAAAPPTGLTMADTPLTEHDDLDALEGATSGWLHDGQTTLWVKLPAGDATAVITF